MGGLYQKQDGGDDDDKVDKSGKHLTSQSVCNSPMFSSHKTNFSTNSPHLVSPTGCVDGGGRQRDTSTVFRRSSIITHNKRHTTGVTPLSHTPLCQLSDIRMTKSNPPNARKKKNKTPIKNKNLTVCLRTSDSNDEQ